MSWKKTEHFKNTEFGPMSDGYTIETTACEKCDRLEAMCEKMAEALDFYSKFASYNESEVDGGPRIPVYWEDMKGRRARLALEEYRAMRDETKMPCPKNE